MSRYHAAIAMVVAGLLGASAAQATAPVAKAKPPVAKVSLSKARAIALKVVPGKIVKKEYGKEDGGWRYSFDIKQKGNVQEVGVDAMTGKIVENKSEGTASHK